MKKPVLPLVAVMAALALAACGARPLAVGHAAPAATRTTPAAPAPAPPPSPVSAQATVTSRCVTGIDDETGSEFFSMATLTDGATTGSGDQVAEAYQLTLTDSSSSATAEITGFAVVFYSDGQDLTSDSQNLATPAFITPGQSLTWTEYPWGTSTSGQGASVGPFAAGQEGAVDTTATCQLVSGTTSDWRSGPGRRGQPAEVRAGLAWALWGGALFLDCGHRRQERLDDLGTGSVSRRTRRTRRTRRIRPDDAAVPEGWNRPTAGWWRPTLTVGR